MSGGLTTLGFIVLYGFYIFVVLIITVLLRPKVKTNSAIANNFFKYVKKGRKRVPLIREHILAFFVLQLLYLVFMFFIQFQYYFIASIVIFYLYALNSDRLKKHRHNGPFTVFFLFRPYSWNFIFGIALIFSSHLNLSAYAFLSTSCE